MWAALKLLVLVTVRGSPPCVSVASARPPRRPPLVLGWLVKGFWGSSEVLLSPLSPPCPRYRSCEMVVAWARYAGCGYGA